MQRGMAGTIVACSACFCFFCLACGPSHVLVRNGRFTSGKGWDPLQDCKIAKYAGKWREYHGNTLLLPSEERGNARGPMGNDFSLSRFLVAMCSTAGNPMGLPCRPHMIWSAPQILGKGPVHLASVGSSKALDKQTHTRGKRLHYRVKCLISSRLPRHSGRQSAQEIGHKCVV